MPVGLMFTGLNRLGPYVLSLVVHRLDHRAPGNINVICRRPQCHKLGKRNIRTVVTPYCTDPVVQTVRYIFVRHVKRKKRCRTISGIRRRRQRTNAIRHGIIDAPLEQVWNLIAAADNLAVCQETHLFQIRSQQGSGFCKNLLFISFIIHHKIGVAC